MAADNTRLSSCVTVAQYRALEAAADRRELARFVRECFDEGYFRPVENSLSKHGFATLAVACLVIEPLEFFYQGRDDTRRLAARTDHHAHLPLLCARVGQANRGRHLVIGRHKTTARQQARGQPHYHSQTVHCTTCRTNDTCGRPLPLTNSATNRCGSFFSGTSMLSPFCRIM